MKINPLKEKVKVGCDLEVASVISHLLLPRDTSGKTFRFIKVCELAKYFIYCRPVTWLKSDSNTGVFLWTLQKFSEHPSRKNTCERLFQWKISFQWIFSFQNTCTQVKVSIYL